jgi:phospholipid transport system substrate-binding protein
MKKFLYVALVSFILSLPVGATEKNTVLNLLKSKLDTAIMILEKKDMKQEEKNIAISELVMPFINFELMGKLSLGKKGWSLMSDQKRKEFTELFIKRLERSYLKELPFYSDEKVIYKEPVASGSKKVNIPTLLVSKQNEISVLYKFYLSNEKWRIYDVEVEGISIVSSYRAQFKEVLKKGTIEDIFVKLEESKE